MTTSHMPAGAGRATPEPQKCEGPGHHPEADANHESPASHDCAGTLRAAQIADAVRTKADATLIARAALAGVELVKLADDTWLASKWGMFRPLATDADVEVWLRRVGAPA